MNRNVGLTEPMTAHVGTGSLALPSEGQEASYVNALEEDLGKKGPIEFQWVLNAPPKPESISLDFIRDHRLARCHRQARDDWLGAQVVAATALRFRQTALPDNSNIKRGARPLGSLGITLRVAEDQE